MIDFEALFKISYGLYIVSSGDKTNSAGFIANAVFQVTSEPPQFAVCCNKNNFSADIVKITGAFSISVLHQQASSGLISTFGYKSGKKINKFQNIEVKFGLTGVPIVTQDCISTMELKLTDTFEVGTHYIFIGELLNAEIIDNSIEPLTYAYYRNVKKGLAPKNAPTYIDKEKYIKESIKTTENIITFDSYKCHVCGYIFEETSTGAFEALPETWICPVCGVTKEDFIKL